MSDETTNCGCNPQPKSEKTNILSRILDKVFVSDVTKHQRMEICKKCDHFSEVLVQCGICGCFLEAKTRLVGFHCALDQINEKPLW